MGWTSFLLLLMGFNRLMEAWAYLLILSIAAITSSSALIASYLIQPTSSFSDLCDHALDKASCLAHISEIAHGPILATTRDPNNHFTLLQSFLINSISLHIEKAMDAAKATKSRVNSPKEESALHVCEELLDSSKNRVFDSMVALTKRTNLSLQDAHAWLSSVLTNHVTCLDELEGSARDRDALLESELEDLISRSRTSLAILVAALPPKGESDGHVQQLIEEALDGEFLPWWVTRNDRKLLERWSGKMKANVVVAKDGSGKFKTVAEAVASAPDNSKTRYVIHVKKGTYKENVDIVSRKKNLMLLGDGMDKTIITGSLNFVDGTNTFRSATVAVNSDGFIGQDIWFKNTAGPKKYQAVALRISRDQAVINRCRVDGYQDTLYAHTNSQFYRDSFIIGTIDFIFGDAAVVLQNCSIVARKPMEKQKNMVTAQGRVDPNQNTGTSIQQCQLSPSSDLKPVAGSVKTYLDRPWKKYSRTVVMESTLGSHIDKAGWAEWDDEHKDYLRTLYYGEYKNRGPGSGTSNRVNWPGYHVMFGSEFTVAQLIQGDVWLKNTGVNFIAGL